VNAKGIISPAEAATARRVLIINVTRIGDTVLATPAMRAIAAYFPNASVTCLGHPNRVEVVDNLPYLSKVGGITKNSALRRGWKDALFGAEYDWAFVWGNDAALLRYALRKARHVVAQRQGDSKLDTRLFAAVDAPPQNRFHAVAWYLSLPQAVGIAAKGFRLDIRVTDAEAQWADQRLRADWPNLPHPLIGMQVASFATKSYRDWPIAHFIALARRVAEKLPESGFVLYGSAEDQLRINELRAALPGRTVSYAGKLSLRQTLAIMSRTDAYLGVDTGPTHLFSAFQKPMVVLYHPSLPSALYRPLEHTALHVLDHPLAGPGADRGIAIGDISVDDVYAALADALAGRLSTRPGLPAPGIDIGAVPYPGDPIR
jgi:heptosyltransferase-3